MSSLFIELSKNTFRISFQHLKIYFPKISSCLSKAYTINNTTKSSFTTGRKKELEK